MMPFGSTAGAIPAGFFEDSLADAKARNVDIKQLASAQAEQDWEQFQEFVAEVEQQDVREDEQRQEEAKERDAEQTLENMQYVDRYRVALERAVKLAELKKRSTKRGADERDEGANDTVASAVNNGTTTSITDTSRIGGEEDAAEQVDVRTLLKKQRTQKKKKKPASPDDEVFDPCNWRSKAL